MTVSQGKLKDLLDHPQIKTQTFTFLFSRNVILYPLPRNDAVNAQNALFDHWIVKFGNPCVLSPDKWSDYFNSDFTHFFRVYNAQFELRTFCATLSNGLIDNNKRQLNRFRLTLLGTQYDTWSQNNSSITIDNSKDCKATQQYQCSSLPKQTHTYHYGHHSEIEKIGKLQKILFAHWFITRKKNTLRCLWQIR